MRPIRIDDFHYLEGGYKIGEKYYQVQDLIKAAENLPVFDLPLEAVNLDHNICQDTLKNFLYHTRRVENADLQYPVILDDRGYVCDGWHRIAKAILLGHTTIKAKRLTIMPEPELTK